MHRTNVCIRSDVFTMQKVFVSLSCNYNSWIFLIGYKEVRIFFIIFEQDVILWLMFFNQMGFQNKRLCLGICNNIVQIRNLRYHNVQFCTVVSSVKITHHATFQNLRFTYIYNFTVFVKVHVTPRQRR